MGTDVATGILLLLLVFRLLCRLSTLHRVYMCVNLAPVRHGSRHNINALHAPAGISSAWPRYLSEGIKKAEVCMCMSKRQCICLSILLLPRMYVCMHLPPLAVCGTPKRQLIHSYSIISTLLDLRV